MEETNEFTSWLAATINAVKQALPEITWADLGLLIGPISGASQAVGGAGQMGAEYAAATVAERDADKQTFAAGLTTFDEDDTDLISRSQDGIKATWALARKATQRDAAERLAAFHASPSAMSDPTSADEWLAVLQG